MRKLKILEVKEVASGSTAYWWHSGELELRSPKWSLVFFTGHHIALYIFSNITLSTKV